MIRPGETGITHTPVSRRKLDQTPANGPVIDYTLSPEELQRYQSMPAPEKIQRVVTIGRQYRARGVR